MPFFSLKNTEDTRSPAAELKCLSFNYTVFTKGAVQAPDI